MASNGGSTTAALQPAGDEIEVSLLGPGYGECVVVHLGGGDWMVVDSCRLRGGGKPPPAALAYLDSIQVPRHAVRVIAVTHWHDDHIRGIAELAAACPAAVIACSSSLRSREWVAFLEENDEFVGHISSGVDEYRQLLRDRAAVGQPLWSGFRTSIWDRGGPQPAEVWALSPAPEEVRRSHAKIAQSLAQLPTTRDRILEIDGPNDASVVIWVKVGGISILLGADLEEHDDPHRGWSAILGAARPASIHDEQATLFKISHHGSVTGHHDGIWSELLAAEPVAVLAPWNRGRTPLPSVDDRRRIAAATPNAYSTVQTLRPRRRRRRRPEVDRMLRAREVPPRAPAGGFGHIRCRSSIGAGSWQVSLYGDAGRITAPP